jgi:hypothetical protein
VLDIAAQLVAAQQRHGIDVVLGGGRAPFMPESTRDPEYPDRRGERKDGRALIDDWLAAQPQGKAGPSPSRLIPVRRWTSPATWRPWPAAGAGSGRDCPGAAARRRTGQALWRRGGQ